MCRQAREWVSLAVAGRKIGASAHAVRRLADRGKLSLLTVPGCHPRVKAAELTDLVSAFTKPRQPAA